MRLVNSLVQASITLKLKQLNKIIQTLFASVKDPMSASRCNSKRSFAWISAIETHCDVSSVCFLWKEVSQTISLTICQNVFDIASVSYLLITFNLIQVNPIRVLPTWIDND